MYLRNATLAIMLASGIFATAAHAQQQGVSANEILLGEVEPLTGPPALLGIAYNVGTKVAIAEANAAGGVDGRKLRLITEDDGYVPTRTIQSVRKMIDVDKIFAFTSLSGSGQGIAVLPIIEKAGIPAMPAIGPVTPLYQPPRKSVFVVGQSYEEGMYQLVRYLATKFPGKKWGILTQDDDYGVALRTGFGKAQKEFNLNVVSEGEYKKGQQDFSSEMLRVRSAGAEVFMAGGVIAENVAMVKELEKLNSKPVVGMFWPGRVPATLKLMGPASEGIYAVDYVDPDNSAAVAAFTERAKKLVSEAEVKAMNRYTLAGYASTRVLIEAMRRCGKTLTWACTIAELEKTKDFESGVMGPISFGPGVRFSSQTVRIMRADFSTLSFKPVQ
jgi:branched-chain amino acid transport system substrate-binding protein